MDWIHLTLSMKWHERSVFRVAHFICTLFVVALGYMLWIRLTLSMMAWKISFPCGALYLVSTLFALPGRLLNSLGATEHIPIICPFVKATVLFFISCRDKTFFCNKDYPKRRVFSEPWSLWATKQILIARIIDRLSREAFFSANPKIWSAKSRTLKPWPCFTDASGFVVTEAEPYQADMKWIVIAAQVLPCLVYLMRWSPMQSERQ